MEDTNPFVEQKGQEGLFFSIQKTELYNVHNYSIMRNIFMFIFKG